MNNDHIVSEVKFLVDHVVAAERFAQLFGNVLDALRKTDAPKLPESIEVSFKEKTPGEFEVWGRLAYGDPPFDTVKRLACGNVMERKIAFNSHLCLPSFLKAFFTKHGWKIVTTPLKIAVGDD